MFAAGAVRLKTKTAAEKDVEYVLKKWMQNCSDKVLGERRKSLGLVRTPNQGTAQSRGPAARNNDQQSGDDGESTRRQDDVSNDAEEDVTDNEAQNGVDNGDAADTLTLEEAMEHGA